MIRTLLPAADLHPLTLLAGVYVLLGTLGLLWGRRAAWLLLLAAFIAVFALCADRLAAIDFVAGAPTKVSCDDPYRMFAIWGLRDLDGVDHPRWPLAPWEAPGGWGRRTTIGFLISAWLALYGGFRAQPLTGWLARRPILDVFIVEPRNRRIALLLLACTLLSAFLTTDSSGRPVFEGFLHVLFFMIDSIGNLIEGTCWSSKIIR